MGGDGGGNGWSRNRESLIAIVLVLLGAIVVIGGGGFLLLTSGSAPPTPTTGAFVSPTPSGLPTFVQETPLPTAEPSPTLVFTPSPDPGLVTPTPLVPPTPLVTPTPLIPPTPLVTPTATPTTAPTTAPTATPRPAPTPRPTATATPAPTPVDCSAATGASTRDTTLGIGNRETRGPLPRTWCVHRVEFNQVAGSGTVRLLRDTRLIAEAVCTAGAGCVPASRDFDPPRRVKSGSTLIYQFDCIDDPATVEDECADANPDGATIVIFYEVVEGP